MILRFAVSSALLFSPLAAQAELCGQFIKPEECREVEKAAAAPAGYRLIKVDAPYTIPGGSVIPNEAYAIFEELSPRVPPRRVWISYAKKPDGWKRGSEHISSGGAALDGISFEVAERLHNFLAGQPKLTEGFSLERFEANKKARWVAKKDPTASVRYVIFLRKNGTSGLPIKRRLLLNERNGGLILVEESTYPGALS